jgi:hypothetical protein
MASRWVPAVGLLCVVAAAAVAGGGVGRWWTPADGGPAVSTERVATRAERRAAREAHRQARRAARADRQPAVRPDPQLPPDERAALRLATRDDQVDALLARVEAHADAAGWSEAELAQVEELLFAATDRISTQLEDVDRGDARWEQTRAALRDDRLASAAALEGILGAERFQALAVAVGLERFAGGDAPIRGRLDGSARAAGGRRGDRLAR